MIPAAQQQTNRSVGANHCVGDGELERISARSSVRTVHI